MKFSWIFPLIYLVLAGVFGILMGGAGHGPGIAITYYISFPLSWIATRIQGDYVMYWAAALGFLQWLLIGIAIDFWRGRRKASKS